MLSRKQIERLVEAQNFSKLADRVLANGRCGSATAHQRLTRPEAAASAGLGLALQRLGELEYAPSELGERLTRRLITLQRPEGLFGEDRDVLGASAAAVRGLIERAELIRQAGGEPDPRLLRAIERGLDAIASYAAAPGAGFRDPIEMEIVIWQLGQIDAFRRRVPVGELARLVSGAHDGTGAADDLARFATAAAA